MLMQDNDKQKEEMHHREITLPDGRYMIFYTFGEEQMQEQEPRENDQEENV